MSVQCSLSQICTRVCTMQNALAPARGSQDARRGRRRNEGSRSGASRAGRETHGRRSVWVTARASDASASSSGSAVDLFLPRGAAGHLSCAHSTRWSLLPDRRCPVCRQVEQRSGISTCQAKPPFRVGAALHSPGLAFHESFTRSASFAPSENRSRNSASETAMPRSVSGPSIKRTRGHLSMWVHS